VAIITVCRTLNEERNIELFCEEHSKISDIILISDGGSEDRTIELAEKFDKVHVESFEKRVYRGDVWRNPHGLHINSMIDWAIENGAEWIIYDDCDSVPNKYMKENLPIYMSNPAYDTIMVRRLYLYKDEGHFPAMAEVGFAIWAWMAHLEVRASEENPWHHHMEFDRRGKSARLEFPSCLMHYSWPDDEEIERKASFYRVAKKIPDRQIWHPTQFGGKIEPVPAWAVL